MAFNTTEYYNRDLSWLRFNHRVLQEATDKKNPLYERIKFLAIFSSNLDEFFKVRISDIRQIKQLDKPLRKKLITKPNKLLKVIKREVDEQQKELGRIFSKEIIPELISNSINLVAHTDFNELQNKFSKDYFKESLAITDLNSAKEIPFIENEALYLVGQVKDDTLVWYKIDEATPRFVTLPKDNDQHYITFVDDILKHNLKAEYGVPFYSIKISRDAELYIENEYSGNLLDKIIKALPKRQSGQVTRILVDKYMPAVLLNRLRTALDIYETDIVKGGVYHNFKDFFDFPNPTNKKLSFNYLTPIRSSEFEGHPDMFATIAEKDRLLNFPYEAYDPIVRLLEEAAKDSRVKQIKITLYRISKHSLVAQALLKAAQKGKDVFVFIETKARFDEANNIKWGKILEKNGANVIYSYPGIKVHSKILLIKRVVDKYTSLYGYISTGNFNEKTSKVYTDSGLLTANMDVLNELSQVFDVLEGKVIIPKPKELLISPFNMRKKFTQLIETEIDNSKLGKKAYITLKLNSLQDPEMINLLYKASNAGVKIRLLIRGICCLVPGIIGQSENISITSIVDRFLEHSRVYIFGNGGEEKMFLGSADWMTRNLDHRIEVITPILDVDIHEKLRTMLNFQLNDTVKARIIDAEQSNEYVQGSDMTASAQHLIYQYLKKKTSPEKSSLAPLNS
ncbi:polyphosphate kinase 1 [Aurantibacter sp.]|uniref:polyphosphate kinase 1 n=1 Tax=Aurantibacter sp. TaxID=2807103 RepID=UPI00326771CF